MTANGPGPASLLSEIRRNPAEFIRSDGSVEREAGLHALLIEHIRTLGSQWSPIASPPDLGDIFHELPASPPKPPQWSDKIDIFTTREGTVAPGVPLHFDLIEAKRDGINPKGRSESEQAIRNLLPQAMRYVDFTAANYAGGNYGAVSASYLAQHFGDEMKKAFRRAKSGKSRLSDTISRSYVLNPRESNPTRVWRDLNLIEYRWDNSRGLIQLANVN